MASHVHSMGNSPEHGANLSTTIINATMAMVLSNVTGMGHNEHMGMDHNMTGMANTSMGMDHSMHGMANVTMGMDHSMHGHLDHNGVTDGNMGHGHGTVGHTGHTSTEHEMFMYFNFQLPIHVLFFGWELTSQGQLAGACVAWLILAIVYEGLRNLREHILMRSARSERKYLIKSRKNDSPDGSDDSISERSCVQKIFSGWHILLSFLQIIQTTLGMFLMLVYMTFNVWLAISVSLGSGVGYWLFAWNKRSVGQFDENHCV